MNQPTMFAVAGPPGSGKSALFPVEAFPDARGFNVDHRCAELNGGSFHGIPPRIRAQAGAECEAFVFACIQARQSFAVETTLRTQVSLQQARLAKRAGFSTELIFISTDDIEENIRRIKGRATLGLPRSPRQLR
jgi:predicted ABC-type ATPase